MWLLKSEERKSLKRDLKPEKSQTGLDEGDLDLCLSQTSAGRWSTMLPSGGCVTGRLTKIVHFFQTMWGKNSRKKTTMLMIYTMKWESMTHSLHVLLWDVWGKSFVLHVGPKFALHVFLNFCSEMTDPCHPANVHTKKCYSHPMDFFPLQNNMHFRILNVWECILRKCLEFNILWGKHG